MNNCIAAVNSKAALISWQTVISQFCPITSSPPPPSPSFDPSRAFLSSPSFTSLGSQLQLLQSLLSVTSSPPYCSISSLTPSPAKPPLALSFVISFSHAKAALCMPSLQLSFSLLFGLAATGKVDLLNATNFPLALNI